MEIVDKTPIEGLTGLVKIRDNKMRLSTKGKSVMKLITELLTSLKSREELDKLEEHDGYGMRSILYSLEDLSNTIKIEDMNDNMAIVLRGVYRNLEPIGKKLRKKLNSLASGYKSSR